jgi:hypothetical protein
LLISYPSTFATAWIEPDTFGCSKPVVCSDGTTAAANAARSDHLCTGTYLVSGLWP